MKRHVDFLSTLYLTWGAIFTLVALAGFALAGGAAAIATAVSGKRRIFCTFTSSPVCRGSSSARAAASGRIAIATVRPLASSASVPLASIATPGCTSSRPEAARS